MGATRAHANQYPSDNTGTLPGKRSGLGALRSVFESHMAGVAEAVAKGLDGGSREERLKRAWALLSILYGGVTPEHAVQSPDASAAIAKSVRSAAPGASAAS